MPRRKPAGWPRYMHDHSRRDGLTAYYWKVPTWAKEAGFPLHSEALGCDYRDAKNRCDEVLNPQLDAWRTGKDSLAQRSKRSPGTFDWLVERFKASPQYGDLQPNTRKGYDAVLRLVSDHELKDGSRFGGARLSRINEAGADRLFQKLRETGAGSRTRTAVLAMTVCKRAWWVARRAEPGLVPAINPFAKMGLPYRPERTRPVSYSELMAFVNAADRVGDPAVGTAAMIAFFWLQRQQDILARLSWAQYRPTDAPNSVRIFHHKTRELVELPLMDEDGESLWGDLPSRLDASPRRATLIIVRDQPDRRSKVHLPWKPDYFRHRVAEIRKLAGLGPEVKFMGLRHGGNVEGADAGLTDAQLRALSGHRTTSALLRYAQETRQQRLDAATRRRDARTKGG